jgi:transcriptional regulator with XRE-family HTH domain
MKPSKQGSYLREVRIEKGFSHQRLAICANLSRTTVIRAEQRGIKTVPLLIKLARALEINPVTLLNLDESVVNPKNPWLK